MGSNKQTPYLRDLCLAFMRYEGDHPYQDVLTPWFFDLMDVLTGLSTYRLLNTPKNDYPVTHADLHQWYALSRLNDCLIANFQNARYPALSSEQYNDFFSTLGFAPLNYLPYHPFHHEIVEVVEDAEWTEEPFVQHVFWSGWMFGEMLFARAGVQVCCSPGTFDKQIAENSRMYFAYWREQREASDLSHGWGSNSQWATSFRRDYHVNGTYYFNVDGTHPLGNESLYKASFNASEWQMRLKEERKLGENALTMEEQIEHLTNRSFVRCRKSDADRWPYDDTYTTTQRS